jgi:hypothetical protein
MTLRVQSYNIFPKHSINSGKTSRNFGFAATYFCSDRKINASAPYGYSKPKESRHQSTHSNSSLKGGITAFSMAKIFTISPVKI